MSSVSGLPPTPDLLEIDFQSHARCPKVIPLRVMPDSEASRQLFHRLPVLVGLQELGRLALGAVSPTKLRFRPA